MDMTGASPLTPTHSRIVSVGGMTGASPVTTIHGRVACHVVASRRIVVTGLAPVMPPLLAEHAIMVKTCARAC